MHLAKIWTHLLLTPPSYGLNSRETRLYSFGTNNKSEEEIWIHNPIDNRVNWVLLLWVQASLGEEQIWIQKQPKNNWVSQAILPQIAVHLMALTS